MRRVSIAVLALAFSGCGPDVESLCERLYDECRDGAFTYDIDEQACIDDGVRMQDGADDRGCSDQFDALLDCVDAKGCHWNTDCVAQREQVLICVQGG